MPDSSISLGLNADPMYSELRTAESRYAAGMDRMAGGTGRLSRAHDNLLKSNARVSNQFAHFFAITAAGGDSMSLLAGGITAAAHAMNLSLGLTAAGYVGGLAIQKVVAMREEWRKLNDELDRAAKPRDPNSTKPVEDDIKEREQALANAAKAKQIIEKRRAQSAAVHEKNLADPLAGPRMRGEIPVEIQNQGEFAVQKWMEAHGKGKGSNGFKPDTSWSEAMKKGLDKTPGYTEDEKFLRREQAARDETERLKREQADKEKADTAAKRQQSKKESMQFSLEDLAKNGREWAPGNDTRSGDGRLARMALKEEALSRKAGLDQHWDEALQHRDRADQIKNSIGGLKDSDKDAVSAYQRGLDSSLVLQKIATNTGKPIVGKP
jgi:hypothetical protein